MFTELLVSKYLLITRVNACVRVEWRQPVSPRLKRERTRRVCVCVFSQRCYTILIGYVLLLFFFFQTFKNVIGVHTRT